MMGFARSSPAFNYYTTMKPHMTVVSISPTAKGFTTKESKGFGSIFASPASCGLLTGSYAAPRRRRTRRIPRWTARRAERLVQWFHGDGLLDGSQSVETRRMPGGYPTACMCRFDGLFEPGPTTCPTTCSFRCGGWFEAEPAASAAAHSCRLGR